MGCVMGCSPKITIRHQDPTHQLVRITLDQKDEGTLEYGEKESFSVSRGTHFLEAVPEGATQSPWTNDGKGWTIWVDRGAELTLLAPPKAETETKKQNTAGYPKPAASDSGEKKDNARAEAEGANPY